MVRAGLGEGWQCLLANDLDPAKAAAYRANWGDAGLRVADIAALTAADLPGVADLMWGSFPCQDLSLAGVGAGLGGRRRPSPAALSPGPEATAWGRWQPERPKTRPGTRADSESEASDLCGRESDSDGHLRRRAPSQWASAIPRNLKGPRTRTVTGASLRATMRNVGAVLQVDPRAEPDSESPAGPERRRRSLS